MIFGRFFSLLGMAVFFSLAFSMQSVHAAAPSAVTVVVPTPADQAVSLTWTNPSSVDFTGTMVRYSTSTFPTSTSDGMLAADVSGSPSGTSSTTVSGLTNGTTYYFSLFSHNAALEYSSAVNAQQLVMASAFSENFQSHSAPATVDGQNGWDIISGTWNVGDTAGEKTLVSGGDSGGFNTYRVTNGGAVNTYSDQMMRVDWRSSIVGSAGQVFLRAQSASADAGGYLLFQSGGTISLSYSTAGGVTMTNLGSAAFTQVANTWYTYEVSVVNTAAGLPVLTAYVWQRGTAKPSSPTLQVTDTIPRHAQGVFSIGKSGTVITEYDNVVYYGMIGLSQLSATPTYSGNVLSWTNPTFASYAGAMVRVSTSAFPTSTTDGSLVASVTGTSAGTSSTTHTGLTNGTRYYYTLFPYDSSGVYGTPIRISQVAYASLFTENFSALNTGNLVGQNNWTSLGGTWTVSDLSGNRVVSGTGTAVTYPTNRALNGNSEATDQVLVTRFRADAASNSAGYVWARQQDSGDGYIIWHNGNLWTISHRVGSTLTQIAVATVTAAPPMEANVWYNLEVTVINNDSDLPVIAAYVWKDGMEKPTTPTVTGTDSSDRWPTGKIAIGRNSGAITAYYDDVAMYGVAPLLTLTSPAAAVAGAPDVATLAITDEGGTFYIPYIQTSTTLNVTASVGTSAGGVEFVLNEGLPSEQTVIDLTSSYTASFASLARAEYTIDAYLLQEDGTTRIADPLAQDSRTDVAIGDIITVVGDSIVEGQGGTIDGGTVTSWLDADVGTVSADNRNFPQHGIGTVTYNEGFLTDLNDTLASYYGYPVFLMNEGRGGIRASNYQSTVMTVGWQTRQTALAANKWIVMLGINDNRSGDSAATFQTNITTLINTFIATYGASPENIWLPYPLYDNGSGGTPYATGLAAYPAAVDAVRSALGLQGGADLLNTMQNYTGTEYADNVHPNAAGYVRVARLLGLSIMKPVVSSATVVSRTVNLAWDDLSSYEATIAGYRIRYGKNASTLTSSTTSASTSVTIAGLDPGSDYYFAVEAYDDDTNDVSYSDVSLTTSALRTISADTSGGSTSGGSPRDNSPEPTVDDGAETDPNDDGSVDDSQIVLPGGTVGASPITGQPEVISMVEVGDYIRSAGFSTVYYVDAEGYRRPFMNTATFFTHEETFDVVKRVTDATLPQLPLGPPMLPAVGRVLVKIESDARVYALVENPDDASRPLLRWVTTEAIASDLYGVHWSEYVTDISPTLYTRFVKGTAVTSAEDALRDAASTMISREALAALAVL